MTETGDGAGTVAVLGAGAMGSALATPLRAAGWEVRLWGTAYDEHLLDACAAGQPHPRTGVPVPAGVRLYRSDEFAEALHGVDTVVLSTSSAGVVDTTAAATPYLTGVRALLLTSKGFAANAEGRVGPLHKAVQATIQAQGWEPVPVIVVGGPCLATEVAAGRPTAAVFGCADRALAQRYATRMGTDVYRAHATEDETGVELCSSLKNVYAIALGITDGLSKGGHQPSDNLKGAVFARAVTEMVFLVEALGGEASTAYGLAGAGDLEVTGMSGRNKIYGSRVGAGQAPTTALAEMAAAEQTVEGVPAARLAKRLVDQRLEGAWPRLPLLRTMIGLVDGKATVSDVVAAALPRL
ncbi:glycerol-3-phosphate dehydrogenase [Longimycelium tulufanense]|uniref:Glycerol-3-phosphate dehydrogenase n=1 Tax=Longimycelium tulufanense TaxID=907463 RepID=A0A8J3FWB0_9PSEU|nr:glycerol-3-phosphate dehydrogenase [Longimycelium tulufanense]GGM70539.1 glycerol-3-phosphate dehydrogenase [Longimycelium tulufanense]